VWFTVPKAAVADDPQYDGLRTHHISEFFGDRGADSPAGTCYRRNLSVQSKLHLILSYVFKGIMPPK
jgi:hypothetical protein